MVIDIVVAHYKENIQWLQHLNHSNIRNIIVYDKYHTSKIFTKQPPYKELNSKIVSKNLSNTGRESHTYLTYCVEYYDNLPDAIFFLQGNPYVHGFGDRVVLSWIKKIERLNFTHTDNYSNSHFLVGMPNGRMKDWYGATDPSDLDMRAWFLKYIDNDASLFKSSCKIYFGANFGVSKDRILSRPKDKYQILLDNEFTDKVNPEAGHYMERSWYYLFNIHKL